MQEPKPKTFDEEIDELGRELDKPPETTPVQEPSKPPVEPDLIVDDLPQIDDAPAPSLQLNQPKRPLFFKRKKFWVVAVLLLVATVVGAWFVQPSRFWLVNLTGAKVTLKLATQVQPESGHPPAELKNVMLDINGARHTTNDKGEAQVAVPYGPVKIIATKAGYQTTTNETTYDFNPFFYQFNLGDAMADEAAKKVTVQLKSVGVALTFKAADWLTGAPLTTGQFNSSDVTAKPDDQGVVSLNVPPTDSKTVKVKASFGGAYSDKEFNVDTQGKDQEFTFTPSGKDYFVSRRSGVLSVYSSDLDGTNQQEVVKGTGQETSAIAVAASPSGKYLALSSSREGAQDSARTVLQKLYIVNVATGQLSEVDKGQVIYFADWAGDTLVYTLGERTAGAATQRLASVDTSTGKKVDLGTANTFSAVRVGLGQVVYVAASSAENSPELRTAPLKGGAERNLGYKVGTLTQIDATVFAYQTSDSAWHSYNTNTGQVGNTSPPLSISRGFVASSSADKQNHLVVDRVDGQTTLIVKNIASGIEKQLYGVSGLTGPIRWVNNTVVFRVVDAGQSADYAISPTGGQPKKITDVTAPSATFAGAANYVPFY